MLFDDFFHLVKNTCEDVFSEVNRWFDKPESLRVYKPSSGGWSINQIVEHIFLTNHFLLILIEKGKEKALKKPFNQETSSYMYDSSILEKLDEIGKHKSFSWIRPEHMEPKGETDLKEIREKIKNQSKQCIYTLETLKNGEGLNSKTSMSVNGLGKIDVYQYIYFLIMHAKRHIEQMEKIEREFSGGK